MITNNLELRVLVKGRPVTEYLHRGQMFIEGRERSTYEIELHNTNPFRIEAIVSVDGLSVIDGKEAGAQSSGYVLAADQTIRIPGWKLDDRQVATFQFAGKQASYAATSTGHARNAGVIGLMAFREQARPFAQVPSFWWNGLRLGGHVGNTWPSTGVGNAWPPTGVEQGFGAGVSTAPVTQLSSNSAMWPLTASACSTTMNASTAQAGSMAQADAARSLAPREAVDVVAQSLGTAFGTATGFQTISTTFERAELHATMVLYYGSARDLKARGIEVGRRAHKLAAQPEAFPAMQTGCTPPPGWRG